MGPIHHKYFLQHACPLGFWYDIRPLHIEALRVLHTPAGSDSGTEHRLTVISFRMRSN